MNAPDLKCIPPPSMDTNHADAMQRPASDQAPDRDLDRLWTGVSGGTWSEYDGGQSSAEEVQCPSR